MGETCGALTGGIMAIGLVVGSEKLEEFDAYKCAMELSYKLYNRFMKNMGQHVAMRFQEKVLEKSYDFKDEKEGAAWYQDGGCMNVQWSAQLSG